MENTQQIPQEKVDVPIIENPPKSDKKSLKKKLRLAPRKKALIKALTSSLGNVTVACETIGLNRSTYYEWLEKDPQFLEAVKEIPERVKDFAETSLLKQIKEGVPSSTIFFLKTKARDRGYIEKIETDIKPTDNKLQVEIIRREPEEIKDNENADNEDL